MPGTPPCHPVSVGVRERKKEKEEKAAEGMDEDTVVVFSVLFVFGNNHMQSRLVITLLCIRI